MSRSVSRGMKQSLDKISPYFEARNICHKRQLSAFTIHLRRYFLEHLHAVDRWVKATNDTSADLVTLEEDLYRRFGITSQALRHFGEFQRSKEWERSKTVAIGHALAIMQGEALEGKLDLDSVVFARLLQVDSTAGHLFSVSTDPAARNLRPFDLTGWERILNGPYEGARVFNGKSAGRSQAPASEIILSASQRELLAPLQAHWRIKQRGERIAGYDPRPIPLLVGPSGSGKTALVRHFAATEQMPMKDFNVGTWIVSGARAEPPTLDEIGDFVRANDRGVLFLDEVDKLHGVSDWLRNIQQEIYALLDGRTDSFPGWDASLAEKLARNFFIVGAGTWQTRYAGRQHALGFGVKAESNAWSIELNEQDEIPEELLMRFNADVLYLRPLTKLEFSERILAIHDALIMFRPTDERLDHLAEKAVVSGRHNRWLEAYASRMLRSDASW